MDAQEVRMISEREAVLRERSAYETGIVRGRRSYNEPIDGAALERASRIAFPFPKRVVPRVVRIGNYDYRVRDGVLEYRRENIYRSWANTLGVSISKREDAVAFLDLFDNPTEEIDDDGSEPSHV